jgi:hypothetical protein
MKLDGSFACFRDQVSVEETSSSLQSTACNSVFWSFTENHKPTSMTQNKLNLYKAIRERFNPYKTFHTLGNKKTIPTERQPLVGEVSANFRG